MPARLFVVPRHSHRSRQARRPSTNGYREEHLPDATKSWGVKKAWRVWGLSDPSLPSGDLSVRTIRLSLDRAMNGEDNQAAGRRFQPRTGPDVSRSRETAVLAEAFRDLTDIIPGMMRSHAADRNPC